MFFVVHLFRARQFMGNSSGLLIILFILPLQPKYDQSAENGFYFAAVLDAMWLVVATVILISVQGKCSKITAPIIIHGDQGRKCGTCLRPLFPLEFN